MFHRPLVTLLLITGLLAALPANASSTFPMPASLAPAVDFWTRVYTEVDDKGGFIHDNSRLDVVYGIIRFPAKSGRKAQQREIKKSIRRWRTVLLNMASGKLTNPSKDEQKILALWGKNASAKTLKNAAYRLRFQRGQANKFKAGIIRSGAYLPYIRKVFTQQGLPAELGMTLPHVESSFTPYARSHAGAAGLWQFTRSTGRRFMRIDHVVDERLDPYRATHAAARLLAHNYSVLKHWPLAITAYNHGLAGMRRAVRSTGTTDMGVIVRQYKGRLFGFASRNFYAAFLAAKRVSSNPSRYFGSLKTHSPSQDPQISVPAYLAVDDLSRSLGIDKKTLRKLNPALQASVWRGEKFVPRGFGLRLPPQTPSHQVKNTLLQLASTSGYQKQKPDRYYKVRKGDSLGRIAKRYGTSVNTLMALNKLRSKNRIRIGQKIRLPGAASPAPTRVAQAPKSIAPKSVTPTKTTPPTGGVYRVKSGDSLALIAQRFGTTVNAISSANGIRNRNQIRIGQKLTIPQAGATVVAKLDPIPTKPGKTTVDSKPISLDEPTKEAAILQKATAPATTPVPGPARTGTTAPGESDEPSTGPAPVEAQPELSADPADYQVSRKGTIEVQAAETLGHYAEWLKLRASDIRKLNRLRYKQPLTIGKRIKLDFRKVTIDQFEKTRQAYHRDLQSDYFERHRITGTRDHKLRRGDSLWTLAVKQFRIPLWLLRQYNPDVDLNAVLPPGGKVQIPEIETIETS